MSLHRRTFLQSAGAAAAGGLLARAPTAAADPPPPAAPRFLIVLTATGGASIIDGPLAVRASESRNAATLNTFPDALVTQADGSPLRAVDQRLESVGQIPAPATLNQSEFVRRHRKQMLVVAGTGTSVNHAVGQRRSVTGNEAWKGRTLQELVALTYGEGLPLPNVHLATGTSFTERGADASLPAWAFGEQVTNPALWPLALDGTKGLDGAPDRELVRRARALRDDRLDPSSRFARYFKGDQKLAQWRAQRGAPQRLLEGADLVSKLLFFGESERYPLSQYGLAPPPDAARVRQAFPNYERDPLEAQGALAFLLLKHRVAVTVTLGPDFGLVLDAGDGPPSGGTALPEGSLKNPPIGFDFAHQAHRATQGVMWHRVYSVADRLISLLAEEEYGDGQSLWDRSLLYVATEFGRTKSRPADVTTFGTGHDLNNGSLIISPLVKGDRVLGGVDPDTGLTYGYDPTTGRPERGREMPESYLFAGLLDVLGVDTSSSGLPAVTALRG